MLTRALNLPVDMYANIHSFTLCNPHIDSTETLTAISLLVYAVYNTVNFYRHHPARDRGVCLDTARQYLREGARRHPASTKVLDNRWSTRRTPHPLPPIPIHI